MPKGKQFVGNIIYFFLLIFFLSSLISGCGEKETGIAEAASPDAIGESTTSVQNDSSNPSGQPQATGQTEQDQAKQGETEPAQTQELYEYNIVLHDSYYGNADTNVTDPPKWAVPTGKIMLINIKNVGKEKHNWAVIKQGSKIPVPYEAGNAGDIILLEPGMVYANSQTTWTINAPEPGEYSVICTVAGHYPFMQGKLVVTN